MNIINLSEDSRIAQFSVKLLRLLRFQIPSGDELFSLRNLSSSSDSLNCSVFFDKNLKTIFSSQFEFFR